MAKTVERKIYFFKLVPKLRPDNSTPELVDLRSGLAEVKKLPYSPAGRYLDDADGTARFCCWPDHLQYPLRARLARVRQSDWPQLEDKGELQPLSAPTNTAGLAESTHFVVFDDAIVGVEFNFYGPRPSRFVQYMKEKSSTGRFDLLPLLRLDATDQLDNLHDVRAFSIRTPASYASVLRRFDQGLGASIDALSRLGKAELVDVVLKPAGRNRTLSRKLIGIAKKIAGVPDSRTELDRLTVKGLSEVTGKVEVIDVLNDLLISKKHVVTQDDRTRAVASESAYGAISEAYAELQGDLRDAAGYPSDQ